MLLGPVGGRLNGDPGCILTCPSLEKVLKTKTRPLPLPTKIDPSEAGPEVLGVPGAPELAICPAPQPIRPNKKTSENHNLRLMNPDFTFSPQYISEPYYCSNHFCPALSDFVKSRI